MNATLPAAITLQPCDLADAIIRSRLSLHDLALILEAVEHATERYGTEPGTAGFDVRSYVELARLESEHGHEREQQRAAESDREAEADRWLQRRIERAGRNRRVA